MGLTTITTQRDVPDSGGWYWVKINSGEWQPIYVTGDDESNWGLTVQHLGHSRCVKEETFSWGPEIKPPS